MHWATNGWVFAVEYVAVVAGLILAAMVAVGVLMGVLEWVEMRAARSMKPGDKVRVRVVTRS